MESQEDNDDAQIWGLRKEIDDRVNQQNGDHRF